jgi:hypothetical protein
VVGETAIRPHATDVRSHVDDFPLGEVLGVMVHDLHGIVAALPCVLRDLIEAYVGVAARDVEVLPKLGVPPQHERLPQIKPDSTPGGRIEPDAAVASRVAAPMHHLNSGA